MQIFIKMFNIIQCVQLLICTNRYDFYCSGVLIIRSLFVCLPARYTTQTLPINQILISTRSQVLNILWMLEWLPWLPEVFCFSHHRCEDPKARQYSPLLACALPTSRDKETKSVKGCKKTLTCERGPLSDNFSSYLNWKTLKIFSQRNCGYSNNPATIKKIFYCYCIKHGHRHIGLPVRCCEFATHCFHSDLSQV